MRPSLLLTCTTLLTLGGLLTSACSTQAESPDTNPGESVAQTQEAVGSENSLQTHRVTIEGTLIGRQRIAYYDTGKDAPAVVFIHSNSCNKSCWERQFDELLADGSDNPLSQYRLLALDLPGHGKTRRLDTGENAYSLGFYADAVAEFAQELDLDGAVYVGHSLGGHGLIEAGQNLPNPGGALIFGTPPITTHDQLNAAFFPMPGGPHFLIEELSRKDIHHWQASVFYSEIPDWFLRAVRRTDPMARSGLAGSLGVLADEVQMVVDYPCPIGIIQGEFERSVRLSYLDSLDLDDELWRGEIQIVNEANHFTQYDQAGVFNTIVADLVAEVN